MARARSAQRGQSLVEFGLGFALVAMVALTAIDMVPAISARGRVLDAAATATERSSRFLAPDSGTPTSDRNALCGQILVLLRDQFTSAGMSTAGAGVTCANVTSGRKIAPTTGANPVVWVSALDSSGLPDTGARLMPTVSASGVRTAVGIEVCVAYTWRPSYGLMWFLSKGPAQLEAVPQNLFTFQFCGRDEIDPYRTR